MDDGGFWISFAGGEMKTTMASLVDDRCDSLLSAIWRKASPDSTGGSRAAIKIWFLDGGKARLDLSC
jgi:hypothetical protein